MSVSISLVAICCAASSPNRGAAGQKSHIAPPGIDVGFDFAVAMIRRRFSCGGAGGGDGEEDGDSDWDDDQEAAFQEEKQLAYEVPYPPTFDYCNSILRTAGSPTHAS